MSEAVETRYSLMIWLEVLVDDEVGDGQDGSKGYLQQLIVTTQALARMV